MLKGLIAYIVGIFCLVGLLVVVSSSELGHQYFKRALAYINDAPSVVNSTKSIVSASVSEPLNLSRPETPFVIPFVDNVISLNRDEYVPPSVCYQEPLKEVEKIEALKHYRWTDENGIVNFSSTPPLDQKSELYDPQLPERNRYFNLNIDFKRNSSVSFLKSRLTAQTTSIYEILSDWIGSERLRQVDVNLLVFPNRLNYLEYYQAHTGQNGAATGGFYSPMNKEAVTYQYQDDQQTYAVSRHESVHVILNGIFGTTPIWLNEGLAQYFEKMEMSNQYQQIDIDENLITIARSAINPSFPNSLSNYLSLSVPEWQRINVRENYALGWSFVYFLASSPTGRQSLSYILQTLADNYCKPIDTVRLFSQVYPGGMNNLQNDFVRWLESSRENKAAHRY